MILYQPIILFFLTLSTHWVYIGFVGLLTQDQIEEVWERNGLKFRAKRFRKYLIKLGLGPMTVSEDVFLRHIYDEFLINFFVKGVREDVRGRQELPSDEPD